MSESTPTSSTLHQRRLNATPRGIAVFNDFFAQRASNAELWDVDGKRYIDFAGGIAVLNTGHRHPRVMDAVGAQMQRFTHTCYNVTPYEDYVRLAERLNALTPGSHAKKTAFFSTGVEAVENAIKIARAATGRSAVVAFNGAFHGRSLLGMALTGKVKPYKSGFGPLPPEVHHVPFPDHRRGISTEQALANLDALFKYELDAARTAAIIVEPVQGEGGFNPAPPAFMRGLRERCDALGIVMIADEIQCGFARTGKWFAMEHSDVVPDLLTMAKSLGGGFPLSAVCGRAELMDAPEVGGLGGTYAGNPLALAAALAVLDVIVEERLCERATGLGQRLVERAATLRRKTPRIVDVRGLGSMIAIDFADPDTGKPDAPFVQRVVRRAADDGLILLSCGVDANVIRFLYPLTIPDAMFDEGLDILEAALAGA